jgi:ribosomal protein S18 acetylase RimI-like enzyme
MSKKFVVEQATIKDIMQVHQCNKNNLPLYYSPYEYFTFIMSPHHNLLVVKDKIVIGYILWSITKNNYHILSFAVQEKYRRCKIGSLLIQEMIQSRHNDISTISLYVHIENTTAINFYEKLEFTITNVLKDYYAGSLKARSQDAYVMTKKLIV